VRYLNLHAPGREFANFMRALRDGRSPPDAYDQHAPPPDGGRPTAEGTVGGSEIVSDEPGRRVTLHADVEAIRVAEVWCDPGTEPVTQAHPDPDHVQSLYVLAGELALTVGDRELRAQAGSWARVPPVRVAAVSAAGAKSARYLDLRTPAGSLARS